MSSSRTYYVRFDSPFTLPGLDRDYPPGSYVVRVDEEALDVSFPATRQVATTVMLPSGAMTQAWPVSSADLAAALAVDAASSTRQGRAHDDPVRH